MGNQQAITIRLHCIELPDLEFDGRTKIRLGIQKGKQVIEDVQADAEEVIFSCSLRVEKNAKTGKPNFLGQYAQGTPEERYLYLCWGERDGGQWQGFRRAKIYLKHIGWDSIEKSLSTGKPIEATIKMTDKKGCPLCAWVKEGNIEWKL